MNHLTAALRGFVNLLDRLGAPYALMGGLAVRVYGIPRATYDIDFTVAVSREGLLEILRAAQEMGVTVPAPYFTGWLDDVGGMHVAKLHVHLEARTVDIDIFLAENDFQRELMSRRRTEAMEGTTLSLVSPEDLVLLKLLAGRPRDVADAGDILFTQGRLDLTYLRSWANRLHLAQALEEAIRR